MVDNKRFCVRLADGALYPPWEATGPAPSPETVAYGLANLCRYGGHVTRFYSVAEHSIWIALHIACNGSDNELFRCAADALAIGDSESAFLLVARKVNPERCRLALLGLIHDSPEGAGLVDLPSPIGRHDDMIPYKDAHDRCATWLCEAWGIQSPPWPDVVKETDHAVLGAEMAVRPGNKDGVLGNGEYVSPWPNLNLARQHDLSRFNAKYMRESWVNAFYTLRNASTRDRKGERVEESRARFEVAMFVLRGELP